MPENLSTRMRHGVHEFTVAGSAHSSAPHRKDEGEGRALAHLAFYPDPTAMQLDELPRQCESEPGPLDLLVRRPHLPKLLEDSFMVFRCDAHARVADGDLGHAVGHRGAHVDAATLGCELEGIGEQV